MKPIKNAKGEQIYSIYLDEPSITKLLLQGNRGARLLNEHKFENDADELMKILNEIHRQKGNQDA